MKIANLNSRPEIFYSILGEGKRAGKTAIFIRLSICNLHCIWCDTDYTWNWEGSNFKHINDGKSDYKKFKKEDWVIDVEIDELIETIESYPCKRIILTGGDPLLQQKELCFLAQKLKAKGCFIEVETNGTLLPITAMDRHVDQYNVSPKLNNSNNELKLRVKDKAMKYFQKSHKSTFKFVIDNKEDIEEVLWLRDQFEINPKDIYLMPQGTLSDTLQNKQHWVVDLCKQYGINFTAHPSLWR